MSPTRKLTLKKETLRVLSARALERVRGGISEEPTIACPTVDCETVACDDPQECVTRQGGDPQTINTEPTFCCPPS